jgi:hypothetical protein
MGCAYHTAHNFLVRRVEDETQLFALIITRLLYVVIVNALSNDPLFWFVDIDDVIFLIHLILSYSFLMNFGLPHHASTTTALMVDD